MSTGSIEAGQQVTAIKSGNVGTVIGIVLMGLGTLYCLMTIFGFSTINTETGARLSMLLCIISFYGGAATLIISSVRRARSIKNAQ